MSGVTIKHRLTAAEWLENMEAEFDEIAAGDFHGLADWAERFMLRRMQLPLLKRGRSDLMACYIVRLENAADAIYRAAFLGELSRNEATNLFMPLAENMARGLVTTYKHLADDVEDVCQQAVFAVFNDLPSGIDKLYGYLVRKMQNKAGKFKKKERTQERFRDEAADGRAAIDADEMVDRTGLGRDRSADFVEAVDALDELDVLCRDDVDRTIMRMRVEGHNNSDIATAIALSTSAVSLRVRKLDGRRDERLQSCCEDSIDEQILRMRVDGKSDKTIARRCGINQTTMETRLRTLNNRYDRRSKTLETLLTQGI